MNGVLDADPQNYNLIKQNFLSELAKASKNKKTSLSYIKHDFSQKPVARKGIIQAIVIGGTNYIVALSKIPGEGKTKILTIKKGELPTFKHQAVFSSFLNEHLDPKAEALGINLAFPLHPTLGSQNELDGIFIKGTKEHAFKGLAGQSIGEFARKIYFAKYQKLIPVAVANDTICLGLSGSGYEDGAMVLGSGFNLSLKTFENSQETLVNLEAGNFDGFKSTKTLKIIDRQSENSGKQLLEKAVAGTYLVKYFNQESKLLGLKLPSVKTSEDLSQMSRTNQKIEDQLARSILKNSASLVACAIAGIYEFKKRPAKLEFITEGSLFWNGWKYRENVKKQLELLGVTKGSIVFKKIEGSSLKGALGLLTH